jgi:hypothetical protein
MLERGDLEARAVWQRARRAIVALQAAAVRPCHIFIAGA